MSFTEKTFKSILNVRKTINPWFWDKYGINPYNGCQFGCIYCDSRSAKYYLPEDFDRDIVVKNDPGNMLDRRLQRSRTLLPDVVGIGGTTDPYQPAESIYQNTRQCLEALLKNAYPVHICTKSKLVLWDLDLLDHIGQTTWCTVSVTITTIKSNIARFLEPRAPAPDQRLEIIRVLKEKSPNIQAGLLLMPVVPFISDRPGDLEDLIKEAVQAGADYILFAPAMTMRDAQALWFLKHLREACPNLLPYYESLYGFVDSPDHYGGRYQPNTNYTSGIARLLQGLCEKHRIPTCIRRFLPDDFRHDNYAVAEKLFALAARTQLRRQSSYRLYSMAHQIQKLAIPLGTLAFQNQLDKLGRMDEDLESLILELLQNRKESLD